MPYKRALIEIDGGKTVPVQFNPAEYSISVSEPGIGNGDKLSHPREETLSLQLHFDTYMNGKETFEKEDVRAYTDPIAAMVSCSTKKASMVRFKWGSLNFYGKVTSVSQKFTMFLDNGKPVRAVMDLTIKRNDREKQVKAKAPGSMNWTDDNWKKKLDIKNIRGRLER